MCYACWRLNANFCSCVTRTGTRCWWCDVNSCSEWCCKIATLDVFLSPSWGWAGAILMPAMSIRLRASGLAWNWWRSTNLIRWRRSSYRVGQEKKCWWHDSKKWSCGWYPSKCYFAAGGLNVAKLVIRTERLGTNKKTLRSSRSHLSSTWRGLLQKDNGAKTLGVVPRPLAKEERTKCGTYILHSKVGCLLHTRSATDVTIRFCSRGCGSSEN